MKILLDENILDSAREYLITLGHDVESVKSMGFANQGFEDEGVLDLALDLEAILVTQNGKDFVSSIPPRDNLKHFGLIWTRENMTKANYKEFLDCINQEILGRRVESLINTIWRVRFKEINNYSIKKVYPTP